MPEPSATRTRPGEILGGACLYLAVEFTRHARNEMRLYAIDEAEVEAVVAEPAERWFDSRGNTRFVREVAGRQIVVIVAREAPNLVITTFERSRHAR